MRVGIATDRGEFGLKEELQGRLRAAGHDVVDFGADQLVADDSGLRHLARQGRGGGEGRAGRRRLWERCERLDLRQQGAGCPCRIDS